MSHTLQEVAKITERPYAVVKKHAQRGKLQTVLEGRSRVVTEEALAAYQAAEGLERTAAALRVVNDDLTELREAVGEAGNAIARLPSHVLGAILDGMPKTGKGGHSGRSTAFLEAKEGIPSKEPPVEPDEEVDPHGGRPVGFQWGEAPRWKHVSESTWAIGKATWTWNGLGWEAGGSIVGREIGEGISPANPYSEKRPMAPSRKVTEEDA